MNPGVAAVIVTYRPEPATLIALIRALSPQVEAIIVADNGGTEWLEESLPLSPRENVFRVDMQGNQGIGRALNSAIAQLQAQGFQWVITFDQDSLPPPNLVNELYESAVALDVAGRCAAVGPAFYDGRDSSGRMYPFRKLRGCRVVKVDPRQRDEPVSCDALITSGMLVSVRAWEVSGGFHEGMFVDYTDTEWCFRVRAAGWSVYGIPSAHMCHQLSDGPAKSWLGLTLLTYSAVRHYFYVRNTFYVATRKFTALPYSANLLGGMLIRAAIWLVFEPNRWGTCRAIYHAVVDSASGRLGPPRPTRY